MKYRKKPVVIEAVQWTGENHREMFDFLENRPDQYITITGKHFYIDHDKVQGGLIIKTTEGEQPASIGDFIVKGVDGEFHPCEPDVFSDAFGEVWEPVDEKEEAGNDGEIVKKLRYTAENSRSKHDVLVASADLHEQQQAHIAELETQLADAKEVNDIVHDYTKSLKVQLAESKKREQAAVDENDFRKTIQLVPLYTCGGHGYSDDDDEDFWCPVCRAHLGTHQGYATTCPRCGQTINPEFDPEWDYQEMKETIWSGLPEKWRGPQEAEKGAAE